VSAKRTLLTIVLLVTVTWIGFLIWAFVKMVS
jgi:hypothetical protein